MRDMNLDEHEDHRVFGKALNLLIKLLFQINVSFRILLK